MSFTLECQLCYPWPGIWYSIMSTNNFSFILIIITTVQIRDIMAQRFKSWNRNVSWRWRGFFYIWNLDDASNFTLKSFFFIVPVSMVVSFDTMFNSVVVIWFTFIPFEPFNWETIISHPIAFTFFIRYSKPSITAPICIKCIFGS